VLVDLTVQKFLEQTASKAPVPGGGSMAALSGAIAASLVEMVAGLTIGRKGFEAVAGRMTELSETAKDCRRRMLGNVDRDAAAFDRVMQAFGMPKKTEVQQRQRTAAVQEAFKEAVQVPLAVAEEALKLLQMAAEAADNGNRNAVTDGAVGVLAARTAVLGALYNVRINLKSIRDEQFVAEVRARVDALESDTLKKERDFLKRLAL
jgi:formiminotetrahydrofolate cyclodeaminase